MKERYTIVREKEKGVDLGRDKKGEIKGKNRTRTIQRKEVRERGKVSIDGEVERGNVTSVRLR